jgi:hypothetical protein
VKSLSSSLYVSLKKNFSQARRIWLSQRNYVQRVPYSSIRGGARNRISPARLMRPKTGNKYPPKSKEEEASKFEVSAKLLAEKSATFSSMLTLGASRVTKAGPTAYQDKKEKRALVSFQNISMVSTTRSSNSQHAFEMTFDLSQDEIQWLSVGRRIINSQDDLSRMLSTFVDPKRLPHKR